MIAVPMHYTGPNSGYQVVYIHLSDTQHSHSPPFLSQEDHRRNLCWAIPIISVSSRLAHDYSTKNGAWFADVLSALTRAPGATFYFRNLGPPQKQMCS